METLNDQVFTALETEADEDEVDAQVQLSLEALDNVRSYLRMRLVLGTVRNILRVPPVTKLSTHRVLNHVLKVQIKCIACY